MQATKRRAWDRVLLAAAALVTGGAAAVGALAGDTERIGHYTLLAELDESGFAAVTEVIDYDFGPRSRRGILRDIPDLTPFDPIAVSSPTANDELEVALGFNEVNLRIGNEDITFRNRHRYRIEYQLATLIDRPIGEGAIFAWNVVGTDWTVPINNAEIHVVTSRALDRLTCNKGGSGAVGGCTLELIAPGHVRASVSGLSSGEGVTVEARLGDELSARPTLPSLPAGPADDPGTGWLLPGALAAGLAVIAGAGMSTQIRALGKEQVWQGGVADAAFGPPSGAIAGVDLVDHAELADMATIEFESPRGLSAAAGGIIHAERVKPNHQVAWLIECAIRDEVVIEEHADGTMTLWPGEADPHPAVAEHLAALFAGRSNVALGEYDKTFATAWQGVGKELEAWRQSSDLWDPAGDRRRRRSIGFGWLAGLVGLGLAFLGGAVANRAGVAWIWIALAGGLVAGLGWAAAVRAWELRVRTPEGSARWLQIESFRRFIDASEARHAEAAAEMGLLRHYTAWAVALDELDHWKKSVEAAAAHPGSTMSTTGADLAFVSLAPSFSSATAQTFTAPSSSGSSGGGGVGGGGGGGGGGGSW